MFSVPLSVGLPRPDVIRHRCPAEPGLSSPKAISSLSGRPPDLLQCNSVPRGARANNRSSRWGLMDDRKRHISFGLPGRLAISGFRDSECRGSARSIQGVLMGVSTFLLIGASACWIVWPGIGKSITAVPSWIWPAAGIACAVGGFRRPVRRTCLVLLLLWFGYVILARPVPAILRFPLFSP